MNNNLQYSIVVPVFNSAKTLAELVERITTTMRSLNDTYEIILIDDCSSDSSWNTVVELQKTNEYLRIIRLGKNVGQFASTFCGVENSKGKYVITIDDDLQYPPEEIPTMISAIKDSEQLLIYGVPKNKKHSLKTKVYSIIMQLFVYLTIFKYYMPPGYYYTGFRIFNKEVLFREQIKGISQHFDIYALWHLSPKFIGFRHVNYSKRKKGKSGQTLRKKGNDAILNAMTTFLSPLEFMRYFSIILLFLVVFALVFSQFVTKGVFMSLLLIFLAVVGICLYIIGIYVGRIFSLKRGYQDYFVIEQID